MSHDHGVLSDNEIPEIDVSHLPQEFSSTARIAMPVPDERTALLGHAARRRPGDPLRIVDADFEHVDDEHDDEDDDDDLPHESSEYVLHESTDETKPYPRTAMLHLMICCVSVSFVSFLLHTRKSVPYHARAHECTTTDRHVTRDL